jgi:hypothetical protein
MAGIPVKVAKEYNKADQAKAPLKKKWKSRKNRLKA